MSTEAEAILEQARRLPEEERREVGLALLTAGTAPRRSMKTARTFVALSDVPPVKDLDEAYTEAIGYFKGIQPQGRP